NGLAVPSRRCSTPPVSVGAEYCSWRGRRGSRPLATGPPPVPAAPAAWAPPPPPAAGSPRPAAVAGPRPAATCRAAPARAGPPAPPRAGHRLPAGTAERRGRRDRLGRYRRRRGRRRGRLHHAQNRALRRGSGCLLHDRVLLDLELQVEEVPDRLLLDAVHHRV